MWNQLPVEIKELKTPDSYKEAVKKYKWDNIPTQLSIQLKSRNDEAEDESF